jgi:SAM-dependent methyltransferase
MEQNPGLPKNYFDIVYSIYAIGWTVDLAATFNLISSYLKTGGIFIFSWDHPFMHCVEAKDEQLVFTGSYYEVEPFTFPAKIGGRNKTTLENSGHFLTLFNRRLSDYINALANADFAVEKVVEETDKETLERKDEFSSEYYSSCKAKRFPLSIIMKARKL